MAEDMNYSVKSATPEMDMDTITRNMSQDILNSQRQVREANLHKDQMFIQSSKMAYRAVAGEDFQGTDEEAVQMGLDMGSRFNYNITGMGIQLAKMYDATDEDKLAMLYIVDTIDKKDITWEGAGRAFKELALDPMNYIFGRSVGTRIALGKDAQHVGKKMLMEAAKRAALGPTAQAGAMGAKQEAGRQQLEIGASQAMDEKVREGYDVGEIATAGAIEAVAGKALEATAGAITKGVKKVMSKSKQAPTESAQGALDNATN